MTAGKLDGRKILLVEDEYFQARDMKAFLEREGASVIGPTGHAEDLPALLANSRIDVALLDIDLGSGPTYATADLLQREGVPFAFLTGYDQAAIPEDLASVPQLEKPANERKVIKLLMELL